GARRLDFHHLRKSPHLRHVQPATPDAGIHGGESRDALRRRRDPSRRDGGGEDLAFRALRPVGHLLSVRPGRVPGDRRALAADPRLRLGRRARGGAAVGTAAWLAQRARRLSVRARLGWPAFKEEVMWWRWRRP